MKNKKLPRPITNLQEVLLELIVKGEITFYDFVYMQGFRTRVSEINKQLKLDKSQLLGVNKFGNTFRYTLHKLPKSELKKAKELYLNLFKTK